ncbi:MAG: porin [Planctomycetota bacterium]|nr:porin [Planctomycetota bacterium]
MSLTKFVGLLAGSTLTLTGVSYAAVEGNNDTATQISELKAEIAALKGNQGEQWLTEQRADQIRGVVQDVLADSNTRSSFQQAGGATAGYNNGFFISSADGNYSLKINALEQVRFVWNNTYQDTKDQNSWGFENRRTQAFFSGNVVDPSWKYLVGIAYDAQNDPYSADAGNFGLYYAMVTKTFGDGFSVSVGQMNVPFTVESNLFNAGSTQMGDYSIFEYMFGAGQQVGAMAKLEKDAFRVSGGWYNMVQTDASGTVGQSWNNDNNQSIAVAGRAEYKVAGTWDQFSKESSFKGEEFGLLIGGGLIWQNGRNQNDASFQSNPLGLTADAQAKFGGFNLIGQFLWQDGYPGEDSSSSVWGFNVQGGAFVTEDLEVFGAWAYADTSVTTNYLQTGANWYFAKNSIKATVMGIIPLNSDAANSGNLRGFEGGVGLSDSQNNFSLVCQLQVMF